MREYCIFTDSGCDLTAEQLKEYDVSVIELEAFVDDKPFKLGETGTIKDFYDMLRNKSGSKTSAVNFDTIEGRFEEVLKQDKDILYIGFSSGLSATTQNAMIAANELSEKYDYIIIDTPPVNIVTDALLLLDKVNGYILSSRANYSNINALTSAIESIKSVGGEVFGVVLTEVNTKNYGKSKYKYPKGDYN